MRPVSVSVTGVATSAWKKLDHKTTPFNVGFGCVVTGTATYTVEHTFDDVDAAATPTAFSHVDVAAATGNKDGNYAFPVRAIRLNVTSGTGTVTMTYIQAGDRG